MKTNSLLILIAITASVLIYSCSDLQNPVGEEPLTDPVASFDKPTEVIIENNTLSTVALNNYEISFLGKSYDQANNRSTFTYAVSGTGIEPALNSFFLETPGCAGPLVAYTPVNTAKVEQEGIKWEASIPTTGTASYSITFAGDLPVGAVNAVIESGNTTGSVEVPGPCKGIYTVSGSVYVDADANQQKAFSESGISNVTVNISSEGAIVASQKTLASGSYTFSIFTGSQSKTFSVEVPAVTGDATDFNEQLFDSYTATTVPPKVAVTVNMADVSGINLGFAPQTQKMISEFENGTILLNTEEPKFWIKQLRFATNNNDKAEVSATELTAYLEEIEGLLIEVPFRFGDNKIQEALDILTRPIKTDLEALLVQLLTAELNVVSGRGSNSLDFDLALLAYGESAAAEEGNSTAAVTLTSDSITTSAASTSSTGTTDAKLLLTSFNYSGGGGGVGN